MEENEMKSSCIAKCTISEECELILRKEWNGTKWNYVVCEIPAIGEMKVYCFGGFNVAIGFLKEIISDSLISKEK